jgi:hypothetical protein
MGVSKDEGCVASNLTLWVGFAQTPNNQLHFSINQSFTTEFTFATAAQTSRIHKKNTLCSLGHLLI